MSIADQPGLAARHEERYNTFRIPSLIVTRKGTVLAFCEGRKSSSSDYGDVDLVYRRSTDGEKVANRHTDGFVAVFGDGHAKWIRWGASTAAQWSIQSD